MATKKIKAPKFKPSLKVKAPKRTPKAKPSMLSKAVFR